MTMDQDVYMIMLQYILYCAVIQQCLDGLKFRIWFNLLISKRFEAYDLNSS